MPRLSVTSVRANARLLHPCFNHRFRLFSSSKCLASETETRSNELLGIVQSHIRAHGPMPLNRYMSLCLGHPTFGYYARQRAEGPSDSSILGKHGDFITSPEISQVFGELIAIWFASMWLQTAKDKYPSASKIRIIELGPGRGTLMDDMLRTLSRLGDVGNSVQRVDLIESSQYMKKQQEAKLAPYASKISIHWHDSLAELMANQDEETRDMHQMVVAHEFFDALPICLLERREEGWREVLVDLADSETGSTQTQSKPLRLALSRSATLSSTLYATREELKPLSTGTRVEICPDAFSVASNIAELVGGSRGQGSALIVDYGDACTFGQSLRGFRKHQIVDPLSEPGETDLTANVDFNWLKSAMEHVQVHISGPIDQRDFLQRMGLEARTKMLVDSTKDPKKRMDILKATNRLIDSTGMGTQYKFMAVTTATEVYPFQKQS